MDKSRIKWSVLFGTLIVVFFCSCGKGTASYISSEPENAQMKDDRQSETDANETEDEVTPTLVYVYICGAIETPGVYEMPEGSRICDVLTKAGGFTKDAAKDYWNQAKLLVDGEMIYVPTVEEAAQWGTPLAGGREDNTSSDTQGKVNINTASKDKLMTIPGVGEARALAIIAYREESGGFSKIEDIKKVAGIKDGVYSKMKDYIVVN